MGYWGWRPLFFCIFISIFIVGCTSPQENAPQTSSTILPQITLTVGTPRERTSNNPQAIPVTTTVNHFPTISSGHDDKPSPASLVELTQPQCYETVNGGMQCFGLIKNHARDAVTQIVIHSEIYGQRGRLLHQQDHIIEQYTVLGQGSAPYRLLFAPEDLPLLSDDVQTFIVSLLHGENASGVYPLKVHYDRHVIIAGRYTVDAQITNNRRVPMQRGQVVLTLFNTQDQLVGYRIVELAHLEPGESRSVQLSIVPAPYEGVLRPRLTAIGAVDASS